MDYTVKKVWSPLLRLYHWTFAISIGTLVVTGLYIHEPWTNSTLFGTGKFTMALFREIHFSAGFALMAAFIARVYLLIFGNKEERILSFAPVTPANIRNFFSTIGYYLYFGKKEHRPGHNAFAGTFYLLTLFLALGQILSGLYLMYPENLSIQGMGLALFGTQQEARFIHHLIMWYFMFFALVHVYIVIWNDIMDPEGLVSSIFTGRKFFEKKAGPSA